VFNCLIVYEASAMHDVLIVGVPLTAILAGILLNRSEVRELRNEMVARQI
jgi:hypothetical protein